MFDFHQKRKMRTIFGSRLTQGILLFLSFFVLMSAYNRYLIALEMESELRKQFDVARKGEQVVIILDEKSKPTVDSEATTTATSTRAWYRFW
jgi:hypothetical protein